MPEAFNNFIQADTYPWHYQISGIWISTMGGSPFPEKQNREREEK